MRVLALAESDAYLKWAASTLDQLPGAWDRELLLLRSPITPTAEQIAAALHGSTFAGSTPTAASLWAVRRRLTDQGTCPDVLLLACTGPTVAAITAFAVPLRRRPVVVSGLPGVALPVRSRAISYRRHTDVFVAHSVREREEFLRAFEDQGAEIAVGLAHLPFLSAHSHTAGGDGAGPVVFAAQPTVPPTADERRQILLDLAALRERRPIVKVRGAPGDPTTHDERWHYRALWEELVSRQDVDGDRIEFASGPMQPLLDRCGCLVTVSSTAALEAIAEGVPVLIVDTFGVTEQLLNHVFDGSGLLGPIDDESLRERPAPAPAWKHDNYFHPAELDDLDRVIAAAVGEAPARRRWPPLDLPYWGRATRRLVRLITSRSGS